MRRVAQYLAMLLLASSGFGGFKAKLVKPKKPEKFQVHTTVNGVTFAADLLLEGKQHKKFFYKELDRSNVIAVRLAIFNRGSEPVVLPLHTLQLLTPDGTQIPPVAPEAVAQAVVDGLVVETGTEQTTPRVSVSTGVRTVDPRADPSDPRYDPRFDPNRPGRTSDPRTDPADPRYDPRADPRRVDPYMRPGVDIVLNPTGDGSGNISQFEKALVEKDFQDKAHSQDPVGRNLNRDKFIYFLMPNPPKSIKGFVLRLPPSRGIPDEIVIKF